MRGQGEEALPKFHCFPEYLELAVGVGAAVNAFSRAVKVLALRPGSMLPADSLVLWREAHPELARLSAEAPAAGADSKHTQIYVGRESFAARVSQAHWLLRRVARDCVDAIVREHGGMHCEIFGLSGWIADMRHSRLSPEHRIQMPDKTIKLSAVVVSDEFARASAAPVRASPGFFGALP